MLKTNANSTNGQPTDIGESAGQPMSERMGKRGVQRAADMRAGSPARQTGASPEFTAGHGAGEHNSEPQSTPKREILTSLPSSPAAVDRLVGLLSHEINRKLRIERERRGR
jgi:hypothetical protein